MKIPNALDNRILAKLASPDETHAVRVVIRRVMNHGPYVIRGRLRQYTAEHDAKLSVHVLDVPASVWMHDFPSGPYRENTSIAHDLQGNRGSALAPLVFLIVPWKNAKSNPAAEAPENGSEVPENRPDAALAALRTFAEKLGAPELMLSAIDLAASGRPAVEVERLLAETIAQIEPGPGDGPNVPDSPNSPAGQSPEEIAEAKRKAKATKAAERMKRMRERKRQKQLEKAGSSATA